MKKFIWNIYLIFLQKIDSTNRYAKKNILIYPNWTVIYAIHQTNGKGVGKNYWDVEKGKNLTFSIILKSINLPIHKGYLINLFICNAIHKTLMTYYHKNNYFYYYNKYNNIFWIKWPNDIILMNKKIGGILIENSAFYKKIHTSIIGIGLNVNQIQFNKKLKASSLKKFFHKDFDLKKLFYNIIDSIQKEYFLLFKSSSPNNNIRSIICGEKIIRNYYIDYLYLKDRISIFSVKNTINHGLIRNITEQGHLIIELVKNKKLYIFSQKEIQFF